jgi:hypothetical protein
MSTPGVLDVRVRRADVRNARITVRRPALRSPHFDEGEEREVRRARAVNNRADFARLFVSERPQPRNENQLKSHCIPAPARFSYRPTTIEVAS